MLVNRAPGKQKLSYWLYISYVSLFLFKVCDVKEIYKYIYIYTFMIHQNNSECKQLTSVIVKMHEISLSAFLLRRVTLLLLFSLKTCSTITFRFFNSCIQQCWSDLDLLYVYSGLRKSHICIISLPLTKTFSQTVSWLMGSVCIRPRQFYENINGYYWHLCPWESRQHNVATIFSGLHSSYAE